MLESVLQTYLVLARNPRAPGAIPDRPTRCSNMPSRSDTRGGGIGWSAPCCWSGCVGFAPTDASTRLTPAACVLERLSANHAGDDTMRPLRPGGLSGLGARPIWLYRDQRGSKAIDGFARLYADARALRFEHRALQLGVSLALAHMARDDKEGAFDVLRRGPARGAAQRREPQHPRFRRRRADDASALSRQRSARSGLGPLRAASAHGQWGSRRESRRATP